MSLLEQLSDLVEDKTPEAIARAVERAKTVADDYLAGPERDLAKSALDRIGRSSGALGHLGAGGLVSLIAHFHLGEVDDAKRSFLAESATYEELRNASHSASEKAIRERMNREAAWQETYELMRDLGKIAIKVLPLILMAA